jgi:hypothetical protein
MKIDRRLRSISPLWFARITKAKSLSGLLRKKEVKKHFVLYQQDVTLDIQSYKGCMVAEGFDFDDVYNKDKQMNHALNCNKCTSIAERVVYPIKHHWRTNSIKYFQRVIREYCNHIERDHGVVLSAY